MHLPQASRRLRRLLPALFLLVGVVTAAFAQSPVGTIEGRVTNPATGGVLERAHITVEGSTLETFSDAEGYFRLTQVPSGAVQIRAFFSGFPSATATVNVVAGQTVQRDFQLAPLVASDSADGGTV